MHPRDTLFSLKFAPADIARWKRAAKLREATLQRWMEEHLRRACDTAGWRAAVRSARRSAARTKMLSQRFTHEDVTRWRGLADYFTSTTDWVEYVLNVASRGVE
jgi:hypothetical protein